MGKISAMDASRLLKGGAFRRPSIEGATMAKARNGDHLPGDLDAIDLKILDALQRDSSLSTAELAEVVGLSQSPCWRRLSQLKEAGYIRGQVALLDAERLGFGMTVFANVRLSAHGRLHLTEFSEAIAKFPEVMECHTLMGAADFLLKIVARDVKSYEQFVLNTLCTLPAVQEIQSTVALSEVKTTTALPICER
jgi:Lrp/AsnC family transcriptional regulator